MPKTEARLPTSATFASKFALQTYPESGSFEPVRRFVIGCVLLLVAFSCVRGQEQERKLVDRLLKPDMGLKNDAQNKKFIGDRTSSMNKQATVETFYVEKKSNSKSFLAIGQFFAKHFNSRAFHSERSAFNTSSQQAIGNSRPTYETQTARGIRDVPQSDKKVALRSYAENGPFLDEGKSQKSLNQQNAPLTIDQVRELLNKNK